MDNVIYRSPTGKHGRASRPYLANRLLKDSRSVLTAVHISSKAEALDTEGQKVTVEGNVREDVMIMAMIGPVLKVQSFESAE